MGDLEDTQNGSPDLEEALRTIEAMPDEDLGEHNIDAAHELIERLRAAADAVEGNIQLVENEPARIMGRDGYRGPESVETVWGVKLAPENVPAIPFSPEELVRAKEHGQRLILRIPLSLIQMLEGVAHKIDRSVSFVTGSTADAAARRSLMSIMHTSFTQLEWVLATVDGIPDSYGKGYVSQTTELVDYVTRLYTNGSMSEEVIQAIQQFRSLVPELERLENLDPRKAAQIISALGLHQLFSPSFAEQYYDTAMLYLDEKGQPPSMAIPRRAVRTKQLSDSRALATLTAPAHSAAHPEIRFADADVANANLGIPFVQRRLAENS